ncbi:hypothetical protein FACS1894167_06700 [Synergistales bacterium]|nr:hypothetical protein FACS1894167_06700 [Synergistales bacterium]
MKSLKVHAPLLMFILSCAFVLVSVLYGNSLRSFFLEMLEYNIEHRLIALSESAAKLVTAEELGSFQDAPDMERPEYKALRRKLLDFSKESDVMFVYFLREIDGKLQYIIDNDFDEETRCGLDTPLISTDLTPGAEKALAGTAVCSGLGHYTVGWDGLLYALAPVRDSSGKVVALAGVDIMDKSIVAAHKRFAFSLGMGVLSIFIVFISGLFCLIKYHGEARRANEESRAKTFFLAGMSHEIRTPMNAVIGLGELAMRQYGKPEGLEYIAGIKQASANLLSIINDILDFSKIESGSFQLTVAPFETASLINDVLTIIGVRLGDKPIEFITDVDTELPSVMAGDETRVRQILLNLLSNAVKYTNEGFIKFTATGERTKDGSVNLKFTVADSGIGIKSEDTARLFGEFVRVDHNRNKNVQGTGLGLSIARGMCRAMGGDVSVESEYGKGSTFTATLTQGVADGTPMGFAYKKAALRAKAADARFTAPDFRVLIVDDIAVNLMVIEGLLAPYEIKITTCMSGLEAIEIMKGEAFDLVLMDHMMPGMDGVEAAAAIRALDGEYFKRVPIIALTANAVSGMKEMFLANSFDDFISKPVEMSKLNGIMEKWVPNEKRMANARKTDKNEAPAEIALNIEGVNAARGIVMTGGTTQGYIMVLKQYCGDAEERASFMARFAETAKTSAPHDDETRLFAIHAHALKSASASIGAEEVSRIAAELEAAGKNKDHDLIGERLGEFREKLSGLTGRIRAAIAAYETEHSEVKRPPGADVAPLMARLSAALAGEDIGAVDDILSELSGVDVDEKTRDTLSKISDLTLVSDFGGALEALRAADL